MMVCWKDGLLVLLGEIWSAGDDGLLERWSDEHVMCGLKVK